MSKTYSLGCQQCRKHIWIAQAGGVGKTLYSADQHAMEALKGFLFEHAGHPLVFGDNCEGEMVDWEEIDWRL